MDGQPEPQVTGQTAFYRSPPYWLFLALGPLAWGILLMAGVAPRLPPLAWWQIGLFAVVYPLLEEIVFRGALQGWLLKQTRRSRLFQGVTIANILTSLAFSLSHLLSQSAYWAAAVFLPSLIFGYCRDRYHSLWPGIVLHIYYNAGFFLWLG